MADPDRAHTLRSSALDIRGYPGIRPLAADYVFNFDRLAPFFSGNPASDEAWARATAATRARPHPGEAVAAVLRQQLERRAAPAAARDAVERLAGPRTVAVVTGQQAGLFGGPLYTLLKGLTALALAARLSQEQGEPAVAVFWVEAEDHDWQEVGTCTVLDDQLEPRTVALPLLEGAGTTPVGAVCLDQSVTASLQALASALPRTEFTDDLLARLGEAYRPGVGMANAFARWLDHTLGHRGLVVFDASDPAAKPLVRDVFVREVEHPGETARLATEAGSALATLGYHAQATPPAGSVALFRMDTRREPIRQTDGGFLIGDAQISGPALIDAVRSDPGRFSPNVLLRPIVQDALFPTVAYVAGPNELAYLAQLKAVYERFSLPMPLIAPRASLTLVDAGAARFLARYEVPIPALGHNDEAALNQLLARQLPASVEQAWVDARDAVEAGMGAVIAAVPDLDPTLEGAARSTLGRIRHDLDTLHGKLIQTAKRRDETLRRQFRRTRAQAFPGGHPQERTIGWVYFLNQYGYILVERLAEALPLDSGHHGVITI